MVKGRNACVRIESYDQCGNTERAHSTTLSILLLQTRNKASDVFHSHRIFYCKTMTLTLNSSTIDKHTCVSSQSSEGKRHMLVKLQNLANGTADRWKNWVNQIAQEKLSIDLYYDVLIHHTHDLNKKPLEHDLKKFNGITWDIENLKFSIFIACITRRDHPPNSPKKTDTFQPRKLNWGSSSHQYRIHPKAHHPTLILKFMLSTTKSNQIKQS